MQDSIEDDLCQNSVWGHSADFLKRKLSPTQKQNLVAGLEYILIDCQADWLPKFLQLSPSEFDAVNGEIRKLKELETPDGNKGLPKDYRFIWSFEVLSQSSVTSNSSVPESQLLVRLCQQVVIAAWLRLPGASDVLALKSAKVPDQKFAHTWLKSTLGLVGWFYKLSDLERDELWDCLRSNLASLIFREVGSKRDELEIAIKGVEEAIEGPNAPKISKSRTDDIRRLTWLMILLVPNEPVKKPVKPKSDKKTSVKNKALSPAEKRHKKILERRIKDNPKFTRENVPILNPTRRHLEMTDELSGNSYAALPVEMMRSCLDHFRKQVSSDNDARAVAAAILGLVGLTGAGVHELIAALGALGEDNYLSRIKFVLDAEGKLVLRFCPPPLNTKYTQKDYASDDEVDGPKSDAVLIGAWDFPVPDELSHIISKWVEAFQARYAKLDELVSETDEHQRRYQRIRDLQSRIVISIWELWYELREKQTCDLYTETRLRKGYLQQLLKENGDPVFAQLILGDDVGKGFAPLHYIRWSKQRVVNTMIVVAREIASERFSFSDVKPDAEGNIATEITNRSNEHFPKFGEMLLQQLPKKEGRPGTAKFFVSSINRKMLLAATSFIVTSTHRNFGNISNVRARDISLDALIVIMRDKPSSPANYRRVAAIPKYVTDVLQEYHARLVGLLSQADAEQTTRGEVKRNRIKLTDKARKLVSEAVDGSGTLFLELRQLGQTIDAKAWSGTKLWGEVSDGELEYNSHRHFFSTHLRGSGQIKPLLVEAQLNHAVASDLIHELGIVSIAEFSKVMQRPLTGLLEDIGFPDERIANIEKLTVWHEHVVVSPVSGDLWSNHLEELGDDRKAYSDQLNKGAGTDLHLRKDELVDRASELIEDWIEENEADSDDRDKDITLSLPRGVVLSALRYIRSNAGGEITRIRGAIREFHVWLAAFRAEHDIEIEYIHPSEWHSVEPPFYTKSCALAADRIGLLRREIAVSADFLASDPLAGFAIHLILYGDVKDQNELGQIIKNLNQAIWVDGYDALVVPLPVLKPLNRFEGVESPGDCDDRFDGRRPAGDQGYCLRGATLTAAVPLINGSKISIGKKSLDERVNDCLPVAFRAKTPRRIVENLIKAVQLEQKINLPPALAAAASGVVITRQMSPDNLINFELNGAFDCLSRQEIVVPKKDNGSGVELDGDHLDREVRRFITKLRWVIRNGKNDSKTSNKALISNVRALKQDNKLGQLGHMIIDFGVYLCGDRVNTSENPNGSTYKKNSILDFISWAKPGIRMLAAMGLENYDPIKFAEYFREHMLHEKDVQNKSSQIIRFFDVIGSQYELDTPPLYDLAKVNFSAADINANCYSSKEISLVPEALQTLFNGRSVSALAASGELAILDILRLQGEYGFRSSEIDKLAYRELQIHDGCVFVVLRDTGTRKLKRIASRRLINLEYLADWFSFVDPSIVKSNQRLGNELVTGDLAFEVSNVISEQSRVALSMISGSQAARRHDFRGSRVSRELSNLIDITEIYARMRDFESLRVSMGHASPLSTIQNYSHNLQSLISIIRRNAIPQKLKQVGNPSRILNAAELEKADRKILHSIESRLKPRQDRSGVIKAQVDGKELDAPNAFRLALQTVNHGFPEAARKLAITQRGAMDFLNGCRQIADEIGEGFSSINLATVDRLIEAEESYLLPFDFSRGNPGKASKIDKELLGKEERKARAYANELAPLLGEILDTKDCKPQWGRGKLNLQIDAAEYWREILEGISNQYGLLIHCNFSTEKEVQLELAPDPSQQLKHSTATLKAIVAALCISNKFNEVMAASL